MSSRGIRTRDLAIHDDRRFWPRFSGILGALVKWLSSRTYAQVPLLEEVAFFMVWFDPDLPVLCIHLNNTGPTARLTARCYRAWLFYVRLRPVLPWQHVLGFCHFYLRAPTPNNFLFGGSLFPLPPPIHINRRGNSCG